MCRAAAILFASLLHATAFAYDCPPPTPGLRDIAVNGYYSDEAGSIRDEAKFKASHEASKPFEAFGNLVARQSDRYLEKNEPDAAACTIAWLERWAQDGAMLGKMVRINNDQSEYVRKWTNATAAIAWNKVRKQAAPEQRARIDAWLIEVSRATLDYWQRKPTAKRNNHYYWVAVGVMATAVATGEHSLLDAARSIYQHGIREIQDDGVLPYEMKRGVRALHYHNYAMMPLVMLAEMARKAGEDWFAYQDYRIDKLAARVAAGFRDPAWFDRAAGAAPQIIPPPADLCWVEIYRLRVPTGEDFHGVASVQNGLYQRALGGKLALMAQRGSFDPR